MRSKILNVDVELVQDNPCPECWIFLDSNRLKQVWMNFLTNAIKYTRSGYIRMGYSVENEGIRFYVEDTGAGIPKDLQNRVFGRFQKLNEFVQGTGLGLAISRAIVEAADGEIGFISEQGLDQPFGHGFHVKSFSMEMSVVRKHLFQTVVWCLVKAMTGNSKYWWPKITTAIFC